MMPTPEEVIREELAQADGYGRPAELDQALAAAGYVIVPKTDIAFLEGLVGWQRMRELAAKLADDHAEFCHHEAHHGGSKDLYERASGAAHIATGIRAIELEKPTQTQEAANPKADGS